MKKLIVAIAALFAAGTVTLCADPVEGFWLSVDDKTNQVTAGWQIYMENGKLYGKILSTAAAPAGALALRCKESYAGFPLPGKVNTLPVAGTPWIFGLRQEKTGQWEGGNIIDPNDGKIYKCKLTFHAADGKKFTADTLEMRAEVGLGIGRSQFWRKAGEAEAGAIPN
jgi:uncharacterized protein (DUF2147 family)